MFEVFEGEGEVVNQKRKVKTKFRSQIRNVDFSVKNDDIVMRGPGENSRIAYNYVCGSVYARWAEVVNISHIHSR